MNFKFLSSKFKQIKRQVWPIRWQYFNRPKQIFLAFSTVPNYLRAIVILSLILTVIGLYSTTFGLYLVLTKEVPNMGGVMAEAVLGASIQHFNPVLEINNEVEQKIIDLIYHPLYRVKFPDLLTNQESKIEIEPILLAKKPEWQDLLEQDLSNRYKRLRFTLREDIFWSNNTPITIDDVIYTFERFKEDRANQNFKNVFRDVEISKVSNLEFDLINKNSNPQLIYLANFQPISKQFFNNAQNKDLVIGQRAISASVTSGYFYLPASVDDPHNPVLNSRRNNKRDNPIRSNNSNRFQTIVLKRNPVQNTKEKIFLDTYLIENYEVLTDIGGTRRAMQTDARNNKIDLYSRFLSTDANLNKSKDIKEKLNLEQRIIPTNTYFSFFINIKRSSDGYFINHNLRKYLICSLTRLDLNQKFAHLIETIPKEKQILPIQLREKAIPDCPASQEENEKQLLETKNTENKPIYSFKTQGNSKKLRIFNGTLGEELNVIRLLTLLENGDPVLTEIRNFLLEIGFPTEVINDPVTVTNILKSKDKNYHLALLPIEIDNLDLYPIFGREGWDILQVSQNNREPIPKYNFEDNLKKYSNSNLSDSLAKEELLKFFRQEYVMFNLYRSKQEINNSLRVKNLDSNIKLLGIYTNNYDLYKFLPQLFIQTKRDFILSKEN